MTGLKSKPMFFKTQSDFRDWLEKNHKKENELIVGFYKVGSGKESLTWSQSVDEALCFGWIDGVRKSIDNVSYQIRFTPRKPKSIWSSVNIKKVEELLKKGLMKPPGITAYEKREAARSEIYSYENKPAKLSRMFGQQFKKNKKAYAYFLSLPPSYQKTAIHWVMSAKTEPTSVKRLNELITDSEAGRKLKHLSY